MRKILFVLIGVLIAASFAFLLSVKVDVCADTGSVMYCDDALVMPAQPDTPTPQAQVDNPAPVETEEPEPGPPPERPTQEPNQPNRPITIPKADPLVTPARRP